jgi:uncharacterized protein YecT (DUF1311 family)
MKWNKRIMIIMVIASLATMTACKNSESSAAINKGDEIGGQKEEKSVTPSDSKAEDKDQEADTAESESESTQGTTSSLESDSTEESEQKENQSVEDPKTNLDGMKSQYMKQLNETKAAFEEEAERSNDYSTYALKYFEDRRFDAWDAHLNEVYGMLKENLSADQFDQLKQEQRLWIKSRDTSAMEASEKFRGTTSEHLEYSATLANLTEARCYDLVRTYMK